MVFAYTYEGFLSLSNYIYQVITILRTSEYSTCVGKMNSIPIIHVNGEDVDAVMKAVAVAVSYRNKWHKDVLIDMLCYRR